MLVTYAASDTLDVGAVNCRHCERKLGVDVGFHIVQTSDPIWSMYKIVGWIDHVVDTVDECSQSGT